MQNLARSIRILLHQPRYTLLAVLTLAAGIGAPSTIFGLLDAVYFRPLPVAGPDRLVDVTLVSPASRFGALSYEEVRDIERSVPAFKDIMSIGQRGVTLHQNGETQLLLIHYVSGRYFPSLGIPMHLGRGFTPADDRADAMTPQVVVNHHLWKERLGAPPDIIGRSIQLNSTMFTVIGVTAPGFVGMDRIVRTDVWVTTAQAPLVVPGLRGELEDRSHRWFDVVARLKDDADIEQARSALDLLAAHWRAADTREYRDARLVAESRLDTDRRAAMHGAAILTLVSLVLLIACANVANLTLARGEGRRREMSIRAALGATRLDLLRQMILESAIVSMAGAAAGVLAVSWLIQLLPALLPPGARSIMLDLRMDARLLGFAALLTLIATALGGVVPAWRASRTDVASALKSQSSTVTAGGRGLQLRDALVVGEIALSGVIMIAAALLVRSFAQTLAVNPGFDTRKNVATFYMVPGLKGYGDAATYRLFEDCRQAVAALPGVKRVSYGIRLPGQGNEAGWSASFTIPGAEPPPGKTAFDLRYTMVGPEYFEVMGTRILGGRGINEGDRPNGAPVAVVSESMARRFWPDGNPIGRRIRMGVAPPVDREVVGIAEDIRIGGLYEPPESYVYVPYAQDAQGFGLLLVEMHDRPMSAVSAVRRRVGQIDSSLPILSVSSIEEHMSLLLFEDRRNAWVALAIAILALTLGAVGVHGVVALITARRRKEIGIRLVLGARRGQLLRQLLDKGLRLALVGVVLGIAGGIAAGRLLESRLHGLDPVDPWSIGLGAIVCLTVAVAASFMPVWRATHLDPAVALRDE